MAIEPVRPSFHIRASPRPSLRSSGVTVRPDAEPGFEAGHRLVQQHAEAIDDGQALRPRVGEQRREQRHIDDVGDERSGAQAARSSPSNWVPCMPIELVLMTRPAPRRSSREGLEAAPHRTGRRSRSTSAWALSSVRLSSMHPAPVARGAAPPARPRRAAGADDQRVAQARRIQPGACCVEIAEKAEIVGVGAQDALPSRRTSVLTAPIIVGQRIDLVAEREHRLLVRDGDIAAHELAGADTLDKGRDIGGGHIDRLIACHRCRALDPMAMDQRRARMGDGVADDECAFHVNRSRRAASLLASTRLRRFESVLQSLIGRGTILARPDSRLAAVHRVIASRCVGLRNPPAERQLNGLRPMGRIRRPQPVA